MWFKLKWWFWWITGVTDVSVSEIENLIEELMEQELEKKK